jgi:hypothetical protein
MMVPYDNDKGRQGHHFFLASSPAANTLSNTNSVRDELFVQSQIQQQLLSPASRSRNGSFQYHSLSPSLQHQAELQPYMSMSSTPQSATLHNSFSGYGVICSAVGRMVRWRRNRSIQRYHRASTLVTVSHVRRSVPSTMASNTLRSTCYMMLSPNLADRARSLKG